MIAPVVTARHFAAGTDDFAGGLLLGAAGAVGGLGALVGGQLCTARCERAVMVLGMLATALAVWPVAAGFGFAGLAAGLLLAGAMEGRSTSPC